MEPEGSLPHSQVPATCPYPEPVRTSPYPHNPTSWRSILIFSSHLRLGLPSGLFPSGFPHQNPVYASLIPHTRYMPRPSNSSRFYHPNNIGWGVQIIKLLFMYFSPLSWSLIFLKILLWITWQFCVFVGWQCGKRTTGCPTRYRTRYFFNNFTTNEDIAKKFEADLPHCVRNMMTS